MAKLSIYNTLGSKKQVFSPIDEEHIRIYACGPTVYNYAHIGNGRMAVVNDLLVSLLKHLYPKVTYVSNITDIDDKIINAAEETGYDISDITSKFEKIYNEDMAALGVKQPDLQPRATEHIQEIQDMIQKLIDNEHAYEQDGHVMFYVPSYGAYGKLSGRDREEQIAGARVEVSNFKKDPADFVLWKPSTDDQPGWESPWGRGRPGWHIECSAMSENALGLPFDIHSGGADLKFPHHENEIAQSCGAHNIDNDPSAYAKYWFHNGFVTIENEKMSKSIGNIQLVHELIKEHKGEVLRVALLSSHYRQPLNWSIDTIKQAKATLDKFYRALKDLDDIEAKEPLPSPAESIIDALCDDLNTPLAFAELNKITKGLSQADNEKKSEIKSSLLACGKLLGIFNENPDEWLGYSSNDIDEAEILKLIDQRKSAKESKDYSEADNIREKLKDMGIEIEDTPNGTVWKKAN